MKGVKLHVKVLALALLLIGAASIAWQRVRSVRTQRCSADRRLSYGIRRPQCIAERFRSIK